MLLLSLLLEYDVLIIDSLGYSMLLVFYLKSTFFDCVVNPLAAVVALSASEADVSSSLSYPALTCALSLPPKCVGKIVAASPDVAWMASFRSAHLREHEKRGGQSR